MEQNGKMNFGSDYLNDLSEEIDFAFKTVKLQVITSEKEILLYNSLQPLIDILLKCIYL